MKIFSKGFINRSEDKKVCGIDLDDVLAVAIPYWIEFVNKFDYNSQEFRKLSGGIIHPNDIPFVPWANIKYKDLFEMKQTIPYLYYRILKELYRRSELKKCLPTTEGAVQFVRFLRKIGYHVVILTGRPQRCLHMTTKWLSKSWIDYDGLVLDENKHIRILESFPNLKFMIEDHRGIANLVGRWGYKVYLIDNEYNQGVTHENVTRVYQPTPFAAIEKQLKDESQDESKKEIEDACTDFDRV